MDFLSPEIFKKSQSVSDSYNINCPFCEVVVGKIDTKFHLNINTKRYVYRCPRCDSSGKLSNLKEVNFISRPPVTLNDLKKKAQDLLNRRFSRPIDLDLMSWALDSEKTPIAYKYMSLRGFTDQDIRNYNLRVGIPYYDEQKDYEVKKWSGRILFPFFRDSKCHYLVGRTYTNAEPRYLNSQGSKLLALYNIENVKEEAILCEGIVSSISAQKITGIPSIAILGKSINTQQVSIIRNKCSKIYLSLDGDTQIRERNVLRNNLMKAGIEVWMIDMPVIQKNEKILKDPDDLKDIYLTLFNQAYLGKLI